MCKDLFLQKIKDKGFTARVKGKCVFLGDSHVVSIKTLKNSITFSRKLEEYLSFSLTSPNSRSDSSSRSSNERHIRPWLTL